MRQDIQRLYHWTKSGQKYRTSTNGRILHGGILKRILSDRGSQFVSDLICKVCLLITLRQLYSTPYNPKCNRESEQSIREHSDENEPRTTQGLRQVSTAVLFAYRKVPQASNGFSPFELLYGRTARGPCKYWRNCGQETRRQKWETHTSTSSIQEPTWGNMETSKGKFE